MQEVYRLGKELVVVYMNGRPIAEPWVEQHAHAIVEAWYPGQEGDMQSRIFYLGM